jgi:threonylcarbamoyladenosine tRNA methylthiotransferase MtaB
VLCGICLGAYGGDLDPKISLTDAVEALEKIPQVSRIRLSSIEAGDVSDALIHRMARSKKLCRHLHIPIQSGDDRILKKMHRKYSSAEYLKLIRKIKRKIPGIAVTTDCLVGFPGETERAFNNTCDLVRKIQPLKVHIFPYSERQGVAAEKFSAHKISPAVIKERMQRLKKISDACGASFYRKFLGKKMQVLMESRVKRDPAFWEGHTDNYIKVGLASGQGLKNKILSVKLKKQSGDLIIGEASRGI